MRSKAPEKTVSTAPFNIQTVQRWRSGSLSLAQDRLAEEVPIALCYNSVSHLVMMASPIDLEDFALGFSLSEGILESADELYGVELRHHTEGIELNLSIPARRERNLKQRSRNLTGRTGCGLCGIDSLHNAIRPLTPIQVIPAPTDKAIQQAVAQLETRQPLNQQTGAVHAAAWCSAEGDIKLLREDVGRHNALDKLIGARLRQGSDQDQSQNRNQGFLLISSRASYEMVHKTVTAGIHCLVAVSAPTALAIRLAKQAGLNVIGFARPTSHVNYSGFD